MKNVQRPNKPTPFEEGKRRAFEDTLKDWKLMIEETAIKHGWYAHVTLIPPEDVEDWHKKTS